MDAKINVLAPRKKFKKILKLIEKILKLIKKIIIEQKKIQMQKNARFLYNFKAIKNPGKKNIFP